MSEPDFCSFMRAAAARKTVKVPLRWVAMTGSHSSSDMLNSIRSRRIPAGHTTPSILPNCSTAVATMRSPPAMSATESATATAVPPPSAISSTTASATSLVGSDPSGATP
jgi:hypothetical protein